jgi:hypothetical protein
MAVRLALPAWDDRSHPTARIGNITLVSWYHVKVRMGHRLASRDTDIHAEIKAVGQVVPSNQCLAMLKKRPHIGELMRP